MDCQSGVSDGGRVVGTRDDGKGLGVSDNATPLNAKHASIFSRIFSRSGSSLQELATPTAFRCRFDGTDVALKESRSTSRPTLRRFAKTFKINRVRKVLIAIDCFYRT
jgi:hypothetical protein